MNKEKLIKVTFPDYNGDASRMMTIQQLKEEYKDYLIIDPTVNEQVDMKKLANLEEVIVMPPLVGG